MNNKKKKLILLMEILKDLLKQNLVPSLNRLEKRPK